MSRKCTQAKSFHVFFDADLYDPVAVEWAVHQMDDTGSLVARKQPGGMQVTFKLEAADAQLLAGELVNLALARTMERRS